MQEREWKYSHLLAVQLAGLGCLLAAILLLQPLRSDAAPRARKTQLHNGLQNTGLQSLQSAAVNSQEGLRHSWLSRKVRGTSKGDAGEEGWINLEGVKGATVDEEKNTPEGDARSVDRHAAHVPNREVGGRLRDADEGFTSDDDLLEPDGLPTGSTNTDGTATARTQCNGKPFINDTWLMSEESTPLGARMCISLRKVCMDQSRFILYDDQYQIVNRTWPSFPQLDRSDLEVRGPPWSFACPCWTIRRRKRLKQS